MDPDAVRSASRVPHGGSDDRNLLDFSANVNPHTPEGVAAVYREALAASRRYPDDGYRPYREAAARHVGCDSAAVVPTAGGLEAIRLTVETTLGPGDTALVPFPSFGEYAREIHLQGATTHFVAHDRIHETDPAGHALAIVCNPNNPTGDATPDEALEAFAGRCRDAGTTLLVDEAFLGFTDRPSMAGEAGVVVARSLTKLFGLPGLRAGFAVATADRRAALETARRPWNLGTPAAAVGTHCMADRAFVERTREQVETARARLRAALTPHVGVNPSVAPFLLLDVGSREVSAVVRRARERGVAVRDATTFRGLDSHARVAVRTREENDALLAALLGDGGTLDV